MGDPSSGPGVKTLPELSISFYEADLVASTEGFIAHKILPPLDVNRQAGTYLKVPSEALVQTPRDTRRAPGGKYAEIDGALEEGSYICVDRGLQASVDDGERQNYAHQVDAGELAVQRITGTLLRDTEKRVADKLFNATTFAGRTAGVGIGWKASNADPVGDVFDAIETFRTQCGSSPDTMAIGFGLLLTLKQNPTIISLLKYDSEEDPSRLITVPVLQELFLIPKIIVGGEMTNTAVQNVDSPGSTFADIWSDDKALLCKTVKAAETKTAQLGRTFVNTLDTGLWGVTESWRDIETRSEKFRVRHNIGEELVHLDAGYLLTNLDATS